MPRRRFSAWTDSVPAARGFVVDALRAVPPQLCETAALLVSELATNVVRHSGADAFTVQVDYFPSDGRLWVGVSDTGEGQPMLRTPRATEENGRGLRLVSLMADRWGASRRRETREKTVWFELLAPSAGPRSVHPATGD